MAAVEALRGAEARAERALELAGDDPELEPVARRALALTRALRGRPPPGPPTSWPCGSAGAARAGRRPTTDGLGPGWAELEARHARGRAALLRQEPAEALPDLQAVWERCAAAGVDEPGAFPVAPDLVEALLATASSTRRAP